MIALRRIKHYIQFDGSENVHAARTLLNQLSRCRYEAELKANEEKAKSDVKDKEIQNRNEIQEIES